MDQQQKPENQPKGILKKVQFQENLQKNDVLNQSSTLQQFQSLQLDKSQVSQLHQISANYSSSGIEQQGQPDSLKNLLSEVSTLLGQAQAQSQAPLISQQSPPNNFFTSQHSIINNNFSQNLINSQQSILMDHSMFKSQNQKNFVAEKQKKKKKYIPSDSDEIEEDSGEDSDESSSNRKKRQKKVKKHKKQKQKKKKPKSIINFSDSDEEVDEDDDQIKNYSRKWSNKDKNNWKSKNNFDNQSMISSASNIQSFKKGNFYYNKFQDKDDNQSVYSTATQKTQKSAKTNIFNFNSRNNENELRVLKENFISNQQNIQEEDEKKKFNFNKNQHKNQQSSKSPIRFKNSPQKSSNYQSPIKPHRFENSDDVFCMICENYINISLINEHSQNCKQNQQKPLPQTNQNQRLSDINSKMNRVKHIVKKIQQSLNEEQIYQKLEEYCCLICEYVDLMVQSDQINELSGNCQAIKVVNQRISQFENQQGLKLLGLAEKLKIFCKQKIEILDPHFFQEDNDNISCIPSNLGKNFSNIDLSDFQSYQSQKPQNKNLYQQDEHQNHTQQQKSKQNKIFSKQSKDDSISMKLQDFYSKEEWNSKQKKRRHHTPSIVPSVLKEQSMQNFKNPNFNQNQDDNLSVYQQYKNTQDQSNKNSPTKLEQTKKRFFDMAAKIKQKYPRNHPAQSVLIAQMYEDVKYTDVSQKDWQKFIVKIYDSQK